MADAIYIVGSDTAGSPMAWSWDGSSLTDLSMAPGSGSFARCLYYYNNALYIGTDDAKIHKFDGAWTYDVAQPLDARDVATILRYDDGVNGELWWVLQGDRPNHLAGVGGISLWYGTSLTTLVKVVGLPAWMSRGLCMMTAGPFLSVITHSDGRAWINSGGGVAAVDATVGGNWTDSGFTNAAAPQHSCFLTYADIGGYGPRYYYVKSTANFAHYKTVITGGATNLGNGAAGWIPHPIYGPHCFCEYLNRLYIMDRRYFRVGYLTGAANYPMDADLNGGSAVSTASDAPAAFAVLNGDLHAITSNAGFNNKSFIQRRVADTNWNKDLELNPGEFIDAVVAPAALGYPPPIAGKCVYDGSCSGSFTITKTLKA